LKRREKKERSKDTRIERHATFLLDMPSFVTLREGERERETTKGDE